MKRKKKKQILTKIDSELETITNLCDGYLENLDEDHKNFFVNIQKEDRIIYPFIQFITRNLHGFKESCTCLVPKNYTIELSGDKKKLKPL